MLRYATSNAALQVTVTSTATSLKDLLDTANGSPLRVEADVDSIELNAEGAIRYSVSGTPTTAIWQILASAWNKTIEGVNVANVMMIASGDTLVNVDLGYRIVD